MQDNTPLTVGVDHVGLAVEDLARARRFFCECLGWRVVGENQSYPASFVSDGNGIVTLWQVEDPVNRKRERVQFLKNTGILGGLLVVALD